MIRKTMAFTLVLLCANSPMWADRPSSANQPLTGTTDPNGRPLHQSETDSEHDSGNAVTAPTASGTDPSAGPANRNPYNDASYRPGTVGAASVAPGTAAGDPRITNGNASTLGTALPAQDNSGGQPGINGVTGQTNANGSIVGAPSGNPGPVGSPSAPSAAPTTGSIGAGGSGQGGAPGAISNAGTHGNNGSGH